MYSSSAVIFEGRTSDIAHFEVEIFQLLLRRLILLRHFLVFLLPLIAGRFKSLNLSFVMTSLNIRLAQSMTSWSANLIQGGVDVLNSNHVLLVGFSEVLI